MAKLSGNYEVVYILNPNLDEEATAAMVAKFKTLVEQNGTLAEVDEWGKRRLARDPELRHTQTGTPVASFRLAVDRDFKDKTTGEKATDWIDVVAWRQTAEFVSRYFTKGRLAVVEGRLQMRDWTDRDGNKRTTAEVVADNVYFGDSKRDAEAGGYAPPSGGFGAPAGGYAPPPAAPSGGYSAPMGGGDQFAELSDDDGELPF